MSTPIYNVIAGASFSDHTPGSLTASGFARCPLYSINVRPPLMTSISPQLKRINANLEGGWVRRWERNIWEGTVSCGEQIVILILIRLATEILWAKSLPSKDNSLALKFDLFPTSRTEAHFHYHYCCGSGAFIQNVAGKLADRDYRPSILAPSEFETGLVIPFANFLPSVE